MARFNRRFEVKREMKDGGNIRPDDSNANSQRNIDSELLEELQKVEVILLKPMVVVNDHLKLEYFFIKIQD